MVERIKRDYLPTELKHPRYVRAESNRLDRVVAWFGAETQLSEIRSPKIVEFKAALRALRDGGKVSGPAAANRVLSRLSHLLHLAAEWGYLEAVPVIHHYPEPKRAVRLTRAHVDLLLASTASRPSLHGPLVFAAGTGCRRGELEALRWGDVDLTSKTIVFRSPKNNEDRVIGILPEVRRLLEGLRSKRPLPVPADAPVFLSPKGRPWRMEGGIERRHFREAVTRSGIPAETRWHDLRHQFGTWARSQGWPRDVIKKWMGHKTDQAAARYSHVSMEELLEAAAGKWDRKPAGKCDTGVIPAAASS
ncbi:MAG: site-specific integrase [Planctomycetes bacterium]|nr:site-specific integrase [Planctomycetota bacterium]